MSVVIEKFQNLISEEYLIPYIIMNVFKHIHSIYMN